jgi:peptidoglycan hydrolase-like protein with peptidoglycan-binding domain
MHLDRLAEHFRAPVIAAGAVLGAVVLAGFAGGLDSDDEAGDTRPTSPVDSALSVASSSAPIVIVATTAPTPKTTLTRTLSHGSAGADVRTVQQRLKTLGFDPGPIDGQYGDLTRAAVWAFEKLVVGLPRDEATGDVTDAMWQQMQQPLEIRPRRPDAASDNHTEIYLPEQVLVVFRDDEPVLISHISSGDGQEWCDEVTISPGEYGNENGTEPLKRGECGLSNTPGGVFEYERKVTGIRQSSLGSLLNPVYFNYGIAVHGGYNVPLQPASHGCIRIPNALSEFFQASVALDDQVYVWDGVKEPEQYGAQLPTFNWRDPDYTTTTTTTTTTVPAQPTTGVTPPPTTGTVPAQTTPPATTTTTTTTTTTSPPQTTTATSP